MTNEEWANLAPLFTPQECGVEMNYSFMLKVRTLRIRVGKPFIVLAGFATKGHSPNSYHYKGRALDFFCRMDPRNLFWLIDTSG